MTTEKTRGFIAALVCGFCSIFPGCSERTDGTAPNTAGTNAASFIEPQVAVGKIHSGMTAQQVVEAIGPPERKLANALEYPRLGLAVMPGDGPVQVVMCGDVTGINGPFVSAFSGRTKEGVGMRSSREDVIRAYGEPAQGEKMRFGLESLTYPALGLTFTLEGGKVHHIIVRLPAAESEPTIAIEPAATPAQK
jgi:hypothetical protein